MNVHDVKMKMKVCRSGSGSGNGYVNVCQMYRKLHCPRSQMLGKILAGQMGVLGNISSIYRRHRYRKSGL